MSDLAGGSSRERWRQVDEILDLALEAPPAERATVVAKACAGNLELMREVESLLLADRQAGRFLEPEASSPTEPPTDAAGTGPLSGLLGAGAVLAGRYRIEEQIGRGGMGAVYRARDLVLESEVAVKVLDPHLLARPGRMEAFRREVRLARLVTHPNVCRVHDIVEDGGVSFITMEYVPGESLAERLERTGELPLDGCLRVLADVARGLAAAHAAGVIHRDLKPGNVLLRQGTDAAVVADFGVAAEATGHDGTEATRAGTRGYMAPEQATGAPPDTRSDLFSFGVLAHRMATGQLPGEETARELPPELSELVPACLRHDPNERPAGANAVLRLLERARGPRASLLVRRGTSVAAAAAVLVAALALWRPTGRAPSFDPSDLLVAAVDTSALDAKEAWLGQVLQRLIVNDLLDAWALEARVAPSAPAAPETTIRARLWRDSSGRLRAAVTLPRGSPIEVQGTALRDLAIAASHHVVESLVPTAARHPTAQELQEVGASDPEAWRQFRRARRAARMEYWPQVRALAADAVRRDPGFVMAWLEIDLTYNKEEQAREPLLDKVIALGDRAQGLNPLSRMGVEFARLSRRKDQAGVARALEAIGALELEGDDLLYIRTRLANASVSQGQPETGLPLFEWIAEKWPHDAAAPKKLADYYLGEDEPVSLSLALRHGQKAVDLAPEDVAARANLARALLLAGEEEAAQAHLTVIAMADPDDKQGAFLTERTNRLFALHMALGDVEEAAVDARRLIMDSGLRHAQGQEAMAAVALSRGAFDEGLEKLGAAAAEYERLDLDASAFAARWQQAWQAYALGRNAQTIAVASRTRPLPPGLADSLSGKYAQRTMILGRLARMEAGLEPMSTTAVASLRKALDRLTGEGEWLRWRAYFEVLIRHQLGDFSGVVAAYRDLATRDPPLPITYQAADALERLGRREEAAHLYERLASHPNAWHQPYRRGQAWLRLGILREQAGDRDGARAAYESLLRLWDRAPRDTREVREAERRLAARRGRS